MRMLHNIIILLVSVVLTPLPALAQCPPPLVDEVSALDAGLAQLLARQGASEAPEARPTPVQISAPSASGSDSTNLADGAQSTSFLGLAIDSGIVETEGGQLTLNLNAFGLKTLFSPSVWTDQGLYEKHALMRRLSATVSSGGQGDSFDRDGDGQADEALEAEDLDDIVAFEGRVRLTKSRDRREAYNWQIFRTKTTSALQEIGSLETAVLSRLQARSDYPLETDSQGRRLTCAHPTRLAEFLNKPDVQALVADLLRQLGPALSRLDEQWKAAAQEVSNRFVLSLAVGGLERRTEFGPDKVYIALRGDQPLFSDQTLKLNAQWTREDALLAADDDPETIKVSAEWATLWKSLVAKDGLIVSFAASWETFDNVPGADFDTISKVGAKLTFPITKGLSLPISVTWANHRDLFTDEDEIVGHFAFSYDLSGLLNKDGEASNEGG